MRTIAKGSVPAAVDEGLQFTDLTQIYPEAFDIASACRGRCKVPDYAIGEFSARGPPKGRGRGQSLVMARYLCLLRTSTGGVGREESACQSLSIPLFLLAPVVNSEVTLWTSIDLASVLVC